MNLTWLGHASFRIDDTPGIIYIDPWKVPPGSPKGDLILITHPHYDHCDPDDVSILAKSSSVIVGVSAVAKKLGRTIIVVEPDRSYVAGSWNVETVSAYNIGKEFHKRSEGWVGFVLTLADGTKVYHTGDTDSVDEASRVEADILLVPCGGTYTMNGAEAGRLANTIKPRLVVPMHWGDIVGSRKDAEEVKESYAATVIPEPLKPIPTNPSPR